MKIKSLKIQACILACITILGISGCATNNTPTETTIAQTVTQTETSSIISSYSPSENSNETFKFGKEKYPEKEIGPEREVYRNFGYGFLESLNNIHERYPDNTTVTFNINDFIDIYTTKMAFVCPTGKDRISDTIEYINEKENLINSNEWEDKNLINMTENTKFKRELDENPESSWFVYRNSPGLIRYQQFTKNDNIDLCSTRIFNDITEIKQDSFITFEYQDDIWKLIKIEQPETPPVTRLHGENIEEYLYMEGGPEETYVTLNINDQYPNAEKIGIVCKPYVGDPEEYFNNDMFIQDPRFEENKDWIVTEEQGKITVDEYEQGLLCSNKAFRGFIPLHKENNLTFARTHGINWELREIS